MHTTPADLGLIGLGTMGRNLLLNMAESGHRVTGYDLNPEQVAALLREAGSLPVQAERSLPGFLSTLRTPRSVLLLVPAGRIVDQVIAGLLPHLAPGDLIIDGGNSHYSDTDRRQAELGEKGILFLGLGVSGGAEGARRGPSMMPGGPQKAWEQVKTLLEATAARVNGEPCVAWLGEGSAGHYVKMVHNGIEYGLMQLLAEAYDLMRRGLGMSNTEMADTFDQWNQGELNAYLVEITAAILRRPDAEGNGRLIDQILDKSKQKGTGKWTSQSAMDLGVAVPVIDQAVSMRILSGYKEERLTAQSVLQGPDGRLAGDREDILPKLKEALLFAFISTYAQGFTQLAVAAREQGYGLDLETVARIWRGGCIIRAALLEDFRRAFRQQANLPSLLVDPAIANRLSQQQGAARSLVSAAIAAGLPVPALSAALAYFDAYRTARLPANLIQAQRDYFGSHTYERTDRPGSFHTEWS